MLSSNRGIKNGPRVASQVATISDLGYSDYSEWFIGHSGSTYYRKSEEENAELFQKIEPNLIYLDYTILERVIESNCVG